MKKVLLFAGCLFLFSSCKKNNENFAQPEVIKPTPTAEVYTLRGIDYSLEQGDGAKSVERYFSSMEYSNKTSVKQSYSSDPSKNIYEISSFKSDDNKAFTLSADSVKINVPVYIDESGKIFLGERKWLYTSNSLSLPTPGDFKYTKYVDPYTKTTFRTSLITKELTITYVATFINKSSGTEIKVKGKWLGSYPVSLKHEEKSEEAR